MTPGGGEYFVAAMRVNGLRWDQRRFAIDEDDALAEDAVETRTRISRNKQTE